jgi:hypothetical protein
VLVLRHTPPVLRVGRQRISLQHDHLVEMRRNGARGAQTRNAAAQDDNSTSDRHDANLPVIQYFQQCMT